MRLTPIFVPILFVTVVLSGCSTQTVTGSEKVKAQDNQFSPNSLSIVENDKVEWTNDGQNLHSITIHKVGDPVTTTKKDTDIAKGTSTDFAFTEDGTFHVYCKYHSGGSAGNFDNGMVMTITVKAK